MELSEELLVELRQYIWKKTGKEYFRRIKSTPNDIMVSCPYHKEGQERKPSMGIKLYTDEKGVIGTCNCFTCHKVTDIAQMVKDLLGANYNEDDVESKFGLQTALANATIVQEQHNNIKFIAPKTNYISESELRNYRYYNDYLKSRNINEKTADMYDIGYDKYNDHITFPIRDIYKRCVGVGRRAIKEKQYYYPEGMQKPLYGVYELPDFYRHIWVVEGPFNLWSLYQYKKTGVALLGTGTQQQYKELLKLNCKDYVLALDGDNAGRNGISKLGNYLCQNRKIVYVACVPDNKDINDMTEEQFYQMAVVPFKEWNYYYTKLVNNT